MTETRLPACVELIPPGRENQTEGACLQAETVWTGFLSASEILDVKPGFVDVLTSEGEFIGKALHKDHTPIHGHPSERRNPTYFGQPTFLVVESPFPQLRRAIVVVKDDNRIYSRPFGNVSDSVEIARKNAQETENWGGDPKRLIDLLAYIDLAVETHVPEFGRTPTPDELFEHSLAWALQLEVVTLYP
jgi:hypothetical protein